MSIFKTAQAGEVKTKQVGKEGCRVTLSVEAAPELVTKCFQNAAVQVQSRAQMQGFRAGKVPLDLVKQNFGGHIKERALDLTVKAAINAAVADAKLDPVAVPVLTKADFANFDDGKAFLSKSPWTSPRNLTCATTKASKSPKSPKPPRTKT